MFVVGRTAQFHASHQLHGSLTDSKHTNVHGHNYRVEFSIGALSLDRNGMVIDFDKVDREIAKLDHCHLNDSELIKDNPTVENVAKSIYDLIDEKCHELRPNQGVTVMEVVVWETDTSSAVYRPTTSFGGV